MTANVGAGDLVDGKYRLIRVIGEGGWGIVFEGENTRTFKRVAIKILRARPDLTADIRARFEREAQAAGRIGSEHIVEVFDLGTLTDGSHYMVMELLSGEDMATRLRSQGAMEPTTAAKLVIQLLDGLAAAHDVGIMHRDLKPENLFLVPTRSGEDFVKILDFGISKFTTPGMSSATMTGAVLGSPCYMAPEQARGLKHVDPRTDLYSVGTLLYEAVCGRVPFDGDNFNDLMFKIALAPRPNPLDVRPDLDLRLAAILVKAISADPKDRFANADEFRMALIEWLATQGVVSVRPPELRRGTRTTPRTSLPHPHFHSTPGPTGTPNPVTGPTGAATTGPRLGPSTPQPSQPGGLRRSDQNHWGDATAAADTTGTPLAAAATLESTPRAGPAKSGAFAAIAAAALLTLLGGGIAFRFLRSPPAPTTGAPPAPSSAGADLRGTASASTQTLSAAPAPPSATPALPRATPFPAETQAVLDPPPPATTPRSALGLTPPRGGSHTPVTTSHTTGRGPSVAVVPEPTKPPEPVAATPVAATPPAPPPPPKTTVESVEGRAIQTGL